MRLLSLFVAHLLAAVVLSASSVPRLEFEEVVRTSPRAVHGVVGRSWSAWDDSRRSIWTHYEIRVTETLRGPSGPTVTISEPGGEVGDVAMRVPGAPRLVVGEETIVFAYPTPLGYWRIRGWGQGLFRLEERNSERVVTMPEIGALRLATGKAASTGHAARAKIESESLSSFLDRVRTLIRAEEGR